MLRNLYSQIALTMPHPGNYRRLYNTSLLKRFGVKTVENQSFSRFQDVLEE